MFPLKLFSFHSSFTVHGVLILLFHNVNLLLDVWAYLINKINYSIYPTTKITVEEKISTKTSIKCFLVTEANSKCNNLQNLRIDKILRQMGWTPLPDRYAQNFKLKWVESRLSVNYDAFREGLLLVLQIFFCDLCCVFVNVCSTFCIAKFSHSFEFRCFIIVKIAFKMKILRF